MSLETLLVLAILITIAVAYIRIFAGYSRPDPSDEIKPGDIRRKTRVMAPREGFTYNPLLRYPRNEACWCGSLKKAKICCLPKTKHAVTHEQARVLEKYLEHISSVIKVRNRKNG